MRKLSDFKNEEAIEVLADLVDPVATIALDKEFVADIKTNWRNPDERTRLISTGLKKYSKEIIDILAAFERMPADEYRKSGNCNIATLPGRIMNVVMDDDFTKYFFSFAETETSSGSATENTEEEGQ